MGLPDKFKIAEIVKEIIVEYKGDEYNLIHDDTLLEFQPAFYFQLQKELNKYVKSHNKDAIFRITDFNRKNLTVSDVINLVYEKINLSEISQGSTPAIKSLDFQSDIHFNVLEKKSGIDPPIFFERIIGDRGPEENPPRKVDINVEPLNGNREIKKDMTLAQNVDYLLHVVIGKMLPNSLVKGDVDPIEPLLQDPDSPYGYDLEVALFPKDFELKSASVVKIRLPKKGASDTARFVISAAKFHDNAQLRIALFHKNHLLQAFMFEAMVSVAEKSVGFDALRANMDLSTSAYFSNLDDLHKRDLYIGINQNQNGNHSLFIKGKVAREISGLNEAILDNAQKRFEKLLSEATFDKDGVRRFGLDRDNNDIGEFESELIKFAQFGSEYYNLLFVNNFDEELRKTFRDIRTSEARLSLQIGRHEVNYTFPWELIYDYPLPLVRSGGPRHPICYGQKLDPQKFPQSKCSHGGGCLHNPELQTYCVQGFWGIRHLVEQVIKNRRSRNSLSNFPINEPKALVCNNVVDSYVPEDPTIELKKSVTSVSFKKLSAQENIFELLWKAESRPQALVIIGHIANHDEMDEVTGPRIMVLPKNNWPEGDILPDHAWLSHQALARMVVQREPWKGEPLSMVFLVSCYNATMNINSLGSIAMDFYSAGASVVFGTQCDITTDLGFKFVKDVLHSLYDEKKKLGVSIQEFRKSLLDLRNPLAFVFTYYGNNDMTVAATRPKKIRASL